MKKHPKKRKCKNNFPGDGHAPHVIPFMQKKIFQKKSPEKSGLIFFRNLTPPRDSPSQNACVCQISSI